MSKKKSSAPRKKRKERTNPVPKESAELKKLPVIFIIIILCAGIGAAWYLATVKLHLKYHPDYVSGCNYSRTVNCDTVQTSSQSELFGIPIALFGIAAYLVMMFLAVMAVHGGTHRQRALSALFSIGLASCAYSVYLAVISIVAIRAVCTFCVLMYAVNLAVTLAAFLSFPRPRRAAFSAASLFGPLTSWPVAGGIAIVFWGSFGGSYALYAGMRSGMIAEYIQRTEARQERPAAAAAGGRQEKGGPVTETDIVPVKTSQGISFIMFPVTPGDHVIGPPDAPVTIVQFGDYNCTFCRSFDRALAPLKQKYDGRVCWVFKHFPMDQGCNPRFKTAHPDACKRSRAAVCAAEQGKFREAHDYLFGKSSGGFSDQDRTDMVTALGLDADRFNECLGSGRPDEKIAADVLDGYKAGIAGTPRTYINGYLLAGEVGIEIMEYYIEKALTRGPDTRAAMTVPMAPSPQTPAVIPLKTARGTFYIDTFEAAVDKQGRAVSMPGVTPAYASWYMAQKACEAVGKRLCTEEEWVTACTGVPAVDNNGNGLFADDGMEGWMFPYGPYYMSGRCHDADSKENGAIGATGVYPGCITAQGAYDLAGNISEWAVTAMGQPVLMGGHFYLGQKASCAFAVNGLGPGVRNDLTGFRCCSDNPVPAPAVTPEDLDHTPPGGRAGMPVTDFSFIDQDGRTIDRQILSRGLTVVTLCKLNDVQGKLELQSLQRLKQEFEPRGINFVVFIVDREVKATKELIAALPFKGTVHVDTDQVSMGVFSARKLPATYVVDADGILSLAMPGGMKSDFDAFRNSLMAAAGLNPDI